VRGAREEGQSSRVDVTVECVTGGAALDEVRALFVEYRDAVGGGICFETFDRELARLPGEYSAPTGNLWIARRAGEAVGCVALRSLEPRVGEMKRLYVRPAVRGLSLGRELVERVIEGSRAIGHRVLRLDTLPSMLAAQRLYRALGFVEIGAYYATPVEGTKFFEIEL
jgi:ribosomal protein S18 acetylase RimI-like enzyme